MITVVLFIIILGLLVIVHEWGHFIVARIIGLRVYEFGFGFPPRACGVYRDPHTKKWKCVWGKGKSSLAETVGGEEKHEEFPNTLYSFNWLPLGGFVKIKGENGEASHEHDSFGFQKAWKRLLVLVAGVIMNVVLAAVLLSIGFTMGLPTDFGGGVDTHAVIVEAPSVVIQQVTRNSPGERAGFQFGDKVRTVDSVPVQNAEALSGYIRAHGEKEIVFQVDRADSLVSLHATPKSENTGEPARIGVILADAGVIRYPWYIAIYKGMLGAGIGLINIFIMLGLLVKNLVAGHGLIFDISGPVGIAVVVGESARLGFNYLLNVTAMISLSLAAINILPIPALDGGRALFVVLEKVMRRRLSMKYEQLAHTIGFVLLMALVVVVTWRDVARLL